MRKRLNLTGQKFGKLTAIKDVGKTKFNMRLWLCKCGCGTETIVTTNHLRNKHTKSCGCLRQFSKGKAAFNIVYRNYKQKAKARNLRFNLTEKEFRKLTKGFCYYCGMPPIQGGTTLCNGKYLYNGIDRIDSTKGYAVDNCVTCCGTCNQMKSNLSFDEFLQHIKKIIKRFNQNEEIISNKTKRHNINSKCY